jgi:hypothetical protein
MTHIVPALFVVVVLALAALAKYRRLRRYSAASGLEPLRPLRSVPLVSAQPPTHPVCRAVRAFVRLSPVGQHLHELRHELGRAPKLRPNAAEWRRNYCLHLVTDSEPIVHCVGPHCDPMSSHERARSVVPGLAAGRGSAIPRRSFLQDAPKPW